MPITKKPVDLIGDLKNRLTTFGQPDADDSVGTAQIKGGLAGMGEGLLDMLPASDDIMPDPSLGLASPLISVYKNKQARELGTAMFKQKAMSMKNPEFAQAGQELAARYPRIAAHMRPNDAHSIDPAIRHATAFVGLPAHRVRNPLDMFVTPLGNRDTRDYGSAAETMFHEATHVAQGLGNRHAAPLYAAVNDITGYVDNPFEKNARHIAKRKTQDASLPPPVPVHKQLEEIANEPLSIMDMLASIKSMLGGGNPDPRSTIQRIINIRNRPKQ